MKWKSTTIAITELKLNIGGFPIKNFCSNNFKLCGFGPICFSLSLTKKWLLTNSLLTKKCFWYFLLVTPIIKCFQLCKTFMHTYERARVDRIKIGLFPNLAKMDQSVRNSTERKSSDQKSNLT